MTSCFLVFVQFFVRVVCRKAVNKQGIECQKTGFFGKTAFVTKRLYLVIVGCMEDWCKETRVCSAR